MTKTGPGEAFCQQAFDRFLKQKYPGNFFAWRKLNHTEEPPDFELTISNGLVWGVEVTQTKLFEKTIVNDELINLSTFRKSVVRFIENEEAEFTAQGLLKGKYVLFFDKPAVNKHWKRLMKKASQKLSDFIKHTQDNHTSEMGNIDINNIPICRIRKVHAETTGLHVQFSAKAAFIHSENNIDTFFRIIRLAIREKTDRLIRKQYQLPGILLILDTTYFSDEKLYGIAAAAKIDTGYFDSAFIISRSAEVFRVNEQAVSNLMV